MYAELILKKCAHCGETKDVKEFYKRTVSPDGFGVYCKLCDNVKSNEYRVKFKDKIRAQRKSFREKNKKRLSVTKNRAGIKLSVEEFDELLNERGNCCEICGLHHTKMNRRIAIDHDHKTGKMRGFLCDTCNRGLGLLKDNEQIVEKTLNYLRKYKN